LLKINTEIRSGKNKGKPMKQVSQARPLEDDGAIINQYI